MVRYLQSTPPPARLSGPAVRGRALVLAPHPDDETIGPGGVICQHADAGDEVHTVFLTAGTSGDPTGTRDKEEYAALRQQEARNAADVLGIRELEFWGFPDNYMVTESDVEGVVARVVDAIERFKPEVVYAPHEGDQHSDHFAAAIVVRRALARLQNPPQAFGFEVWSACPAAFVVDISAQYERKMQALKCYPSQLEHTDIERFVTGLNAYRAVFLAKGAKFGEAYVPLTKDATAGTK